YRQSLDQPDAVQVLPQQALVAALVGCTDLDLFGKTAATKDGCIDTVEVIRRPDQENIVLRLKLADEAPRLLDQLDVVLRLKPGVAGQQTIHLVDEDDRRAVLLRSGKEFGELLYGCAGCPAEDVSGRDRVEAPSRLRRDQPRNHGLAGARRSDQQQPCR